jgi:glutamate dehydrogenase
MARESFLDDLESQMRVIVSSIVVAVYRADSTRESAEYMDEWMATKKQWLSRWMAMLDDIQQSSSTDFAMFSVAIRTLAELSLSCAMNE